MVFRLQPHRPSRIRWFSVIAIAILSPFLLLLNSSNVFGAGIHGTVTDAKTKEPLAGVRIAILGTRLGAISGLDGSYTVKNIEIGSFKVKVTSPGFETITLPITVESADQSILQNFGLTEHTVQGSETVVTGQGENGSDIGAVKSVKNADNVINAVSARTIQVSPDLSVAEVSQRVSGITMTHNSTGDAQYAVIRGMDKRYNYTTVNGIKIASPDNKDSYVPLDIFPSELLDRLEVYKTLLPSMEGDAVGGVMNLVMKQAPDRLTISANAATGYDGFFFNQKFTSFTPNGSAADPRLAHGNNYPATMADFPNSVWDYKSIQPAPNQYYGLSIGDRFLENRNLGAIVSATYQNSYRGTNTTFFANVINQNTADAPALTDINQRTYSDIQTRAGAQANVDYELDDNNKFTLFGTYVRLDQTEQRDNIDTNLQLQYQGPGSAGQIINDRRSELTQESIGDLTLSGFHTIFGKDLEAHWDIAYSKASMNMPDQAVLELATGVKRDSSGRAVQSPVIVDLVNSRVWSNNSDEHKSALLNLKSTETLFGIPAEFTYGALYRATNRLSSYDNYQLRPGSSANTSSVQYYNGNIALDTFRVFNPGGTSEDALNYTAHENITAGYLQAKLQIGDLQAIGGVRFESTDLGWLDALPVTDTGVSGQVNYVDMLPSVTFKYSPGDNVNWRLSYFRSLNRPTFYELIPFITNATLGDDYQTRGNPFLNRAIADNVDARWELFPGGLDQLIVGAFYKNIQNPIEYAILKEPPSTFYLAPENFGTATNFGFELDATKYISVFGVKLNYTFTKSVITTDKTYLVHDPILGTTVGTTTQSRPMQGQAAHVGNLSLLYRDFDNGTDAQIGIVYTGEQIVAVSPYLNEDIWQNGYTQIDFSAEQRIMGGLTVYLKINNLLNLPIMETIHQPYDQSQYPYPVSQQVQGKNVVIRSDQFDRTYILGLRYKF